jgi:hypothetical protein
MEIKVITQEVLLEMFTYLEGDLIYRIRPARNVQIGTIAGCPDNAGYRIIRIAGKAYKAHRLVWLYHTGNWPAEGFELDHIDEDKANNRIDNLREATSAKNKLNVSLQTNNKSGHKGVHLNRLGTYSASAKLHGKHHWLGSYPTAEEASAAYQAFAKANHGEFYRAPAIV